MPRDKESRAGDQASAIALLKIRRELACPGGVSQACGASTAGCCSPGGPGPSVLGGRCTTRLVLAQDETTARLGKHSRVLPWTRRGRVRSHPREGADRAACVAGPCGPGWPLTRAPCPLIASLLPPRRGRGEVVRSRPDGAAHVCPGSSVRPRPSQRTVGTGTGR